MQDKEWNEGIWDTSWDNLFCGNKYVQGHCEFLSTVGAVLTIPFGDISESRISATNGIYLFTAEEKRYPYLYGFTQDGISLALLDALSDGVARRIPGGSKERLRSSIVLESKNQFDPSAPVVAIRVEVKQLAEWLHLAYSPQVNGGVLEVDLNSSSITIPILDTLSLCGEIRVGLNPVKQVLGTLSVTTHCYVYMRYSFGASLSKVLHEDLERLRSLFSFLFARRALVDSLAVKFSGGDNWVNVHMSSPVEIAENGRLQPAVAFESLEKEGLLKLSNKWFSLTNDEFRSPQVLTSLLSKWQMPFDLRQIAASTMLESLMRANGDELYTDKELDKLAGPILDASDPKIRERLRGILGLLKHESYNMLLERARVEGAPWVDRLIPKWSQFKKKQHAIRITGAHGKTDTSDFQLRVDHYHASIVIAYIVLMRRLGLSERIVDEFEKSSFLNYPRERITQRYSKSES